MRGATEFWMKYIFLALKNLKYWGRHNTTHIEKHCPRRTSLSSVCFIPKTLSFPSFFLCIEILGAGDVRGVVLSLPEPSLLLGGSSPTNFVTKGSGHWVNSL